MTATPDHAPDTETPADPDPRTENPGFTDEYREILHLCGYSVKAVFDMMGANPMMTGMMGAEVAGEMRSISAQLNGLLSKMNPHHED